MTPASHATAGDNRRTGLAVLLALAFGFLLIALVSAQPVYAFRVLLTGPLPEISWGADGLELRRLTRFGAVLEDAITLCLLGLAMACGLRARQFSMGADGQLFLSALAAAWVSVHASGWPPAVVLPLAALAAVTTGLAWGWLPGLMKTRWQANEIVSSLMLNLIAIQLYRLVITRWFNDPGAGFLATPLPPASALFTAWLPGTSVGVFLVVAPLAAALAWFVLNRSSFGYELRAVGDSEAFARHAGIPVQRTIVWSLALGGALAGLAGLHMSNALLKRLPVELTPGIGFEGLVVALLARNDPKAIPMAALGYAYLKAGAQAMERVTDVPREVVLIVQAAVLLLVVCERLWPQRWNALLRARRPSTAFTDGQKEPEGGSSPLPTSSGAPGASALAAHNDRPLQ